ncbi:MAG: hypothetical protein K0R12_981 [Gammaproteobacteria bacterium]|jgi:hypothetical protein|nr:hypothetical protein [Gammaproteobacteria bacterium]
MYEGQDVNSFNERWGISTLKDAATEFQKLKDQILTVWQGIDFKFS